MTTFDWIFDLPVPILITLGVELFLILVSLILFIQPHAFFGNKQKARRIAWYGAWFALCILFCWSFFLGSLVTLHRLRM